jgi:hypothetical protein
METYRIDYSNYSNSNNQSGAGLISDLMYSINSNSNNTKNSNNQTKFKMNSNEYRYTDNSTDNTLSSETIMSISNDEFTSDHVGGVFSLFKTDIEGNKIKKELQKIKSTEQANAFIEKIKKEIFNNTQKDANNNTIQKGTLKFTPGTSLTKELITLIKNTVLQKEFKDILLLELEPATTAASPVQELEIATIIENVEIILGMNIN